MRGQPVWCIGRRNQVWIVRPLSGFHNVKIADNAKQSELTSVPAFVTVSFSEVA